MASQRPTSPLGRGPVHDYVRQLMASITETHKTLEKNVTARSKSYEQRWPELSQAAACDDPCTVEIAPLLLGECISPISHMESVSFVSREGIKLTELRKRIKEATAKAASREHRKISPRPKAQPLKAEPLQTEPLKVKPQVQKISPRMQKVSPRPKEKVSPRLGARAGAPQTKPIATVSRSNSAGRSTSALGVSTPVRPASQASLRPVISLPSPAPQAPPASHAAASSLVALRPVPKLKAVVATPVSPEVLPESPVNRGVKDLMKKFQANAKAESAASATSKNQPFAEKRPPATVAATPTATVSASPYLKETVFSTARSWGRGATQALASAVSAVTGTAPQADKATPVAVAAPVAAEVPFAVEAPGAAVVAVPVAPDEPVAIAAPAPIVALAVASPVAADESAAAAVAEAAVAEAVAAAAAASAQLAESVVVVAPVEAEVFVAAFPASVVAAVAAPTAAAPVEAEVSDGAEPMPVPSATRPKGGASRARMRSGCLFIPEAETAEEAAEEAPIADQLEAAVVSEEAAMAVAAEEAAKAELADAKVAVEEPVQAQPPAAEQKVPVPLAMPAELAETKVWPTDAPQEAVCKGLAELPLEGLQDIRDRKRSPTKKSAKENSSLPEKTSPRKGAVRMSPRNENLSPNKHQHGALQMSPRKEAVEKKEICSVLEVLRQPLSPKKDEDNYELSDKGENSDEEDECDRKHSGKHVPKWCSDYLDILKAQSSWDPDTIFGSKVPHCDNAVVFPDELYARLRKERPNRRRGSSQDWKKDRLRSREVTEYKRKMQQTRHWTPSSSQHRSLSPSNPLGSRNINASH